MKLHLTSAFLIAGLSACTSNSINSITTQKIQNGEIMNTQVAANSTQKLWEPTVEETLKQILLFVDGIHQKEDITVENYKKLMNLPGIKQNETEFGFGIKVNEDWGYSASIVYKEPKFPYFKFDLSPNKSEDNPSMSSVCIMGMNTFSEKLKKIGYQYEYGQNGPHSFKKYRRDQVTVRLHYQGESEITPTHYCIHLIEIK